MREKGFTLIELLIVVAIIFVNTDGTVACCSATGATAACSTLKCAGASSALLP